MTVCVMPSLITLLIIAALFMFIGMVTLATIQSLVDRDQKTDALNHHYKQQGE